ncbi:hypothetical protein E2C01_051514 [Portunus trituberculatus]|uniref:Uncharacterized protein n=1 Tax=Portunus trituberculatus TaxID=210409 RepID=A0A5B7GLZ9_PORTR|nr:hypothetical protein [Portunus trituberculatus]
MEKINRQDLLSLSKIMKSQCLRNIKKLSFPHRMVDICNDLSEEIVTAESVHKFEKSWIKIDTETGHYEPHSNPIIYN